MAFSVSPSVIVREVDASASVPAIATAPASMAGVFKWGPVNEPILITSETQLVDRFGKPTDDNYETFFTAADYLAYANAIYVVRADNDSNTATGSVFTAKYPGALGNSIQVAYCSATGFESAELAVGEITLNEVTDANTAQTVDFNASTMNFEVALANRITSVGVGDVLRIGNDSIGYQELTVTAFTEQGLNSSGADEANTALVTAYDYDIGFTPNYTLSETSLSRVSITKKWSQAQYFSKAPDANHLHVAVIDRDGGISGAAGTVLETFENLSTVDGAQREDGSSKYLDTVILNGSSWVNMVTGYSLDASTAISTYENMTLGGDAQTESTATLSALGFAYDTLKNTNEIDISFVLQGKGKDDGTTANYIISNVAEYRKDCVAFVSPSSEATVGEAKSNTKLNNIIAYRNKVQNSSYSFIDSGYKYRYDKYNDKYRWTPLNGDMAGLASRVEVWESPAGYRKGVIKNVIKLAFNPSKPQRDALYSVDVNPVMSQAGQGIVLFGDKTGYGVQSAFDRLNVRRLFIAVEKAIATAAQGFLFELNDEFTQTQFKNIVDPFLRDIQGRRGIVDFRVVSDTTVNTPAVVDQNKFRANIFIQPARSINVIELTFVATRTGVEFDEIVGSIR